jgi:hypothetical protein
MVGPSNIVDVKRARLAHGYAFQRHRVLEP